MVVVYHQSRFKNSFVFSPTYNLPLYKPFVKYVGFHPTFFIQINPTVKLVVSICCRSPHYLHLFRNHNQKGKRFSTGRNSCWDGGDVSVRTGNNLQSFRPLSEMTLHFLGSLDKPDSSEFQIRSCLSSIPNFLTVSSKILNRWFTIKGFFVALYLALQSFVAFFKLRFCFFINFLSQFGPGHPFNPL